MGRIEPKEVVLKDGGKCIIREAEKSDAESMLKLFDAAVADDEFTVTTVADLQKLKMTVEKEEKYIEEHKRSGSIILLAEIDNQIVGMVGLQKGSRKKISHVGTLNINVLKDYRDEDHIIPVCWKIININVLKDYRDEGIGTALLNSISEWAKNDPFIEKIGLDVFSNNPRAINLYKKSGFVEQGRKVKEIKISTDNYVDSILMYKFVK